MLALATAPLVRALQAALVNGASVAALACTPPPFRLMSGVDDATFAAFTAWMRGRGITWDDDELRLAPRGAASGGGVFAARRIAPCAVVARIPKVAALTVRTSPIAEELRAAGVRRAAAAAALVCPAALR